jgi:hypothetical protein
MTRYFLRDETSTEVDPCILLWAPDVDFDLNFAEMVSWLVSYQEAAARSTGSEIGSQDDKQSRLTGYRRSHTGRAGGF